MHYTREKLTFHVNGTNCAAYLYLPSDNKDKRPCVILANGFSGTMDWLLPAYAERFAEEHYAAFIFDYRYFGESAGMPRQWLDIDKQREDIHAAIEYAKRLKGIDSDRIILWGTSLGGGHVFHVALQRTDIAAVIAQVPAFDMVSRKARATISMPARVVVKILGAAVLDAIRGRMGLQPFYAKVYGAPGETAVFQDRRLQQNFKALAQHSRFWKNRFTPRFYLKLPRYYPGMAAKLTAPMLVCIATKDVYANPAFQRQVALEAASGAYVEYDTDHFALYHGLLDQVVRDQLEFLREAAQSRTADVSKPDN